MSSEAAFLAAVREDPAGDTPRLVLADWLEDRGDSTGAARAELIRVQCELSHWVPDLRRRTELQEREQQLLARHGEEWLGLLPRFCRSWRFERGLARVTIDARRFVGKKFAAQAEALFRHALVEEVRLERAAKHLRSLAAAPHLSVAPRLDLDGNGLRDPDLATLLASPHLDGLGALDLANNALADPGLHALASSPVLARLNWLDLRNNQVTAEGAQVLRKAAESARLSWLDLHGNLLPLAAVQAQAAWQRQRPARPGLPRLVNSAGMELALVPAGTFVMGSPEDEERRQADEPQHEVEITRPFYLGVYAVTQAQFEAVMGRNPSEFDAASGGGPSNPVDMISYTDAVEFCARLSARAAERAAGRVYRLPTEAEWEYACRAGTCSPFHLGPPPHASLCNYDGNYNYGGAERGPYLERTTPVGSYPANAFGLYDLHGNIWEFCADWYGARYYKRCARQDPPGPKTGTARILRGGCWDCVGWYCRSAHRQKDRPDNRDHFNGFRVALDAGGGGA